MSWYKFKQNIINKLCNAKQVPDINYVAKTFADEYDAVIKRGGTIPDNIKVLSGNKDLMETFFLSALQKGLNSTQPYDLVGEMGKGVKAYWSTAKLSALPIPLPTTQQISTNVIANLTTVSNSITDAGTWNTQAESQQNNKDNTDNINNNDNNNPADNKNKKILIVGDSITVDASYTWSGRWKAASKDSQIEILAKGAQQLIAWMKPELEAKLKTNKYDKVYIYGGVNDAFSGRTVSEFLTALQSMVDTVKSSGAEAVVIVGYDAVTDMDTNKMAFTRYVKTKEKYDELKEVYINYQNSIPTTIKNAIIVPKVQVGVLSDGFHPYDNKTATKLYQHISKY